MLIALRSGRSPTSERQRASRVDLTARRNAHSLEQIEHALGRYRIGFEVFVVDSL